MSIDDYEKLSELIHKVDENAENPDAPYWFTDDEGMSYCETCIKSLRPNAQFHEDYSGGFCCESDSCEHCENCGRLLDYTLTDYGVTSELEHFIETGFDWKSPAECYELARVIHGMLDSDPRQKQILALLIT